MEDIMAMERRDYPADTPAVDEDVYTMAEAARLKGVSYHTVSRAVRRGTLPARRLGRMALISADELRGWRPMIERAPKKYRRREPDLGASPALVDLASGERVALARHLGGLLEIVRGASALQLDEFLPLACDRIVGLLGLDRAAIWVEDDQTGMARRVAAYGIREGEDVRPISELGAGRNGFVASLQAGGQLHGVLTGEREGTAKLTPEDLATAQAIADLAGLAMAADGCRD
jgi:excisionase family DNA binding protein